MLELLKGFVDIEEGLEGRHRKVHREHDRVDGDTVAHHPKDE